MLAVPMRRFPLVALYKFAITDYIYQMNLILKQAIAGTFFPRLFTIPSNALESLRQFPRCPLVSTKFLITDPAGIARYWRFLLPYPLTSIVWDVYKNATIFWQCLLYLTIEIFCFWIIACTCLAQCSLVTITVHQIYLYISLWYAASLIFIKL